MIFNPELHKAPIEPTPKDRFTEETWARMALQRLAILHPTIPLETLAERVNLPGEGAYRILHYGMWRRAHD